MEGAVPRNVTESKKKYTYRLILTKKNTTIYLLRWTRIGIQILNFLRLKERSI